MLAPFQTKLSSQYSVLSHPSCGIVIPTLNEENSLTDCLQQAFRAGWTPREIVVADGGSHDRTVEIAQQLQVEIFRAPPGRAQQMNAGAAALGSEILLFLHADTKLQPGSRDAIEAAVKQGAAGGCFLRYFRPETPKLHVLSWFAAWRAWGLGIAYGDQALWIRRDVFETLGRFPEIGVFEDVELALQIMEHGPFEVLRPAIMTDARRFVGKPDQLMKDAGVTWRYYLQRLRGSSTVE